MKKFFLIIIGMAAVSSAAHAQDFGIGNKPFYIETEPLSTGYANYINELYINSMPKSMEKFCEDFTKYKGFFPPSLKITTLLAVA